jgi:hypothetical protein
MDKQAELNQLEGERIQIEEYLNHPITRKIVADNAEQQKALVDIICDGLIVDIESFFKHFQSVGHLRGLRRAQAIITDTLEEVTDKIKELNNQ